MPPEEVSRVNPAGDLVHSAGNICIHGFSLDFLERMADEKVWEKMQVKFSFCHPDTHTIFYSSSFPSHIFFASYFASFTLQREMVWSSIPKRSRWRLPLCINLRCESF
jgi:hypothetical protein